MCTYIDNERMYIYDRYMCIDISVIHISTYISRKMYVWMLSENVCADRPIDIHLACDLRT